MNNIEKSLDHFFKELQHTPGEWLLDCRDDENRKYPYATNGLPVYAQTKNGERLITDVSYAFVDHSNMKEYESNAELIRCSPSMLRTLCWTYLTLLVKFAYGQNDFCTSARISLNETLASLRNEISQATGLECQHIQDKFEGYATAMHA